MIKELKVDFNIYNNGHGACIFERCLEEDENILFHITDLENLKSIDANGFKSKAELAGINTELVGLMDSISNLDSISFATKSLVCMEHAKFNFIPEKIIIIVDYSEIKNNADVSFKCFSQSDEKRTIYIKSSVSQLKIIGYVRVPMDDNFRKKVMSTVLGD